jgi:sterol desaturase/sphingolipid hydroxylase (fatty acid hydroxylase superfamily)
MLALLDVRVILITALIFIPLERLLPLRNGQKLLRDHWLNDSVYLFFNGIIIKLGLLALIAGLFASVHTVVPDEIGATIRSQPIWLQVIEVLVIADTGFYFAHRCFHAVPFLWKFHAVHHSIEEMDWLAAHRVHPLDQIATKTVSYLPVFLLGFSSDAIVIFALIYQWQSLIIHSNSRISLGPLKWLLATPQFHHWHHANEIQAFDKNFAGQLPLLDKIFGTLFLPPNMPARYGIDEPVPVLYHQQLAYPLRQAAVMRKTEDAPA